MGKLWAVVYTDEQGRTVVDVFPENKYEKATEWAVRMVSLGFVDAKVCVGTDMYCKPSEI